MNRSQRLVGYYKHQRKKESHTNIQRNDGQHFLKFDEKHYFIHPRTMTNSKSNKLKEIDTRHIIIKLLKGQRGKAPWKQERSNLPHQGSFIRQTSSWFWWRNGDTVEARSEVAYPKSQRKKLSDNNSVINRTILQKIKEKLRRSLHKQRLRDYHSWTCPVRNTKKSHWGWNKRTRAIIQIHTKSKERQFK